ncbi:MAG: hypothetical protein ACOCXJ_07160, partial [Planctomycetota bacterium]
MARICICLALAAAEPDWRPLLQRGELQLRSDPSSSPLIRALAVDASPAVHVAGRFDHIAGVPAALVARWSEDGGWEALGSGDLICTAAGLQAVLVDGDGGLWVAGAIHSAGGQLARGVARLVDGVWEPVGSGLEAGPVTIHELTDDGDGGILARGAYAIDGQRYEHGLLRLGADDTWEHLLELGTTTFGTAEGSAAVAADGAIWVADAHAGAGRLRVWRPAGITLISDAFTRSGSGQSWLSDVILGEDGSVYVTGLFDGVAGVTAGHVARYRDGSWTPLAGGFNAQVAALAMDRRGGLWATNRGAAPHGVSRARSLYGLPTLWNGSGWEDPCPDAVDRFTAQVAVGGDEERLFTVISGGGYHQSCIDAAISLRVRQLAVQPEPTSLGVHPAAVSVQSGGSVELQAVVLDASGASLVPQPELVWQVLSGPGSVDASGLFSADAGAGEARLQVTSGALTAEATIRLLAGERRSIAWRSIPAPSPFPSGEPSCCGCRPTMNMVSRSGRRPPSRSTGSAVPALQTGSRAPLSVSMPMTSRPVSSRCRPASSAVPLPRSAACRSSRR